MKKNTDDKIAYLTKAFEICQNKLINVETQLEGEQVKNQVANEKVNMLK